ncbi:hypothetical protein H9Q72_006423 [Fusarium xylarioides]|uniref:Uncharacterized protein n=1 Tax=Fusarium xylarioides TaxID=221167 RepID=A0A9P7L6K9_9HYPO|nr:hypothetical protein H9Q70_002262 [Fusarium xylarioides]KAG5765491.1 hypothetical protein H9Q72_006423 [Fusarium xylarioides]
MSFSHGNKAKISDKMEMVSRDEFLRRLGPGGRRSFVTTARNSIATYEEYAARNLAETAHDNIQLRNNVNPEKASTTKSSQEMDNVRKIGRLMERVEVLEAENRALKKKNAEFEDKNRSLKRKNTEFEDEQAKMVKLLTDE